MQSHAALRFKIIYFTLKINALHAAERSNASVSDAAGFEKHLVRKTKFNRTI